MNDNTLLKMTMAQTVLDTVELLVRLRDRVPEQDVAAIDATILRLTNIAMAL